MIPSQLDPPIYPMEMWQIAADGSLSIWQGNIRYDGVYHRFEAWITFENKVEHGKRKYHIDVCAPIGGKRFDPNYGQMVGYEFPGGTAGKMAGGVKLNVWMKQTEVWTTTEQTEVWNTTVTMANNFRYRGPEIKWHGGTRNE